MGTLQIMGWQIEVVDGQLETKQTWNSNLLSLNPHNCGMANSSWKCTIGNKTHMILQFVNLKTMLETFQTLQW